MSKYPVASWIAALKGDLKHASMTTEDILNQEKQGQQDFINKSIIPRDCPRIQLEKLGFVFGKEIDDLFINVIMLPGWEKKASNHSMWSYIYDQQGRCRADIFYKAAWYDRSAFLTLRKRYDYERNYTDDDQLIIYLVTDCGRPIHEIKADTTEEQKMDVRQQCSIVAKDWLDQNYPSWMDPLAYWD